MNSIGSRDQLDLDDNVLQYKFTDSKCVLHHLQDVNTVAISFLQDEYSELLSLLSRIKKAASTRDDVMPTQATKANDKGSSISSTTIFF